ncbi:MAG: cobalamin-binding protein [Desulfobacteraceae bacterium]|nr:cobalamin-binding protein [Desulfobacteraceae bacterium]
MSDLKTITETLLTGDGEKVVELTRAALDAGIAAKDILNQGLIAGMDIVGERMESGEMFIPEVLMAAQAMGGAVEILKPLLSDEDAAGGGTIVLGTVKGDLHDIGKNLVSMMMESAGFKVINMGVDIEPDAFIQAIKDNDADILALSALLTTTMPMMEQTIKSVEESGLRDKVKILVGGAPVNQSFADEIGADGYAPDAGSASKLAKQLIA